jgi:pre-mRNA-processing factor 8
MTAYLPPGMALPPGFGAPTAAGSDDDGDNDARLATAEAGDADEPDEFMLERRKEWLKLNRQRHNVRESFKAATSTKAALPPEYLRKIIRDHGDLSAPKFKDHRRLYIGALRFMPHAILKLLENIPMPWERARFVDVVYHTAGAITIINETPKCIEAQFRAQWAATWVALRREKRTRGAQFRRILAADMTFADHEKPLDFATHVMDLDPPGAVTLELDENEDSAVFEWFYDLRSAPEGVVKRPSRPRFQLDIVTMATLLRLGSVLLPEIPDRFLWTLSDFFSAKALNVALPGGPKFQLPAPPERDEDADEEWTDFTDLGKVIVRHPITTEMQLAQPWLYSKSVEGVRLRTVRDRHLSVLASTEGTLDTAAFSFSASYNPIRDVPNAPIVDGEGDFDDDLDGFTVPDDFAPFASDVPLEPEGQSATIRQGIDLLFAPAPFNRLVGPLRRPVDVAVIDPWYRSSRPAKGTAPKTNTSYQRLLKGYVKRELKRDKEIRRVTKNRLEQIAAEDGAVDPEQVGAVSANTRSQSARVVDQLAETKFFQKTNIEWLEAGMQLAFQGHTMLALLLRMRNMTMVDLDYNFNARPTKILSTKERKKTRLGQSFHLVRELLKLVKTVVDLHLKYRLGKIDGYQLADALHYTFTHMAKLTGIYRYKYKTMQQVRQARDLKHLIYHRFNTGEVLKGPGAGFWFPAWRIWMHFLRGMAPLLQRYLGNLLARLFEGRKNKGEAKRLTKQRVESNFDLNLKAALKQALIEALPEGVNAGAKARVLESHANEAWRCWRANIPWVVKGMPGPIENLIRNYVKEKADNYVRQTYYNRERITKGDVVDKGVYMKNLGRLTRLRLREEQDRQSRFLAAGPAFAPHEAVAIYKMLARWLEARNFTRIDFPRSGLRNEKELLAKSLDRLRMQHNVANRLTQEQREEQKRIEDAFDAPQEALNKIRGHLAKTRIFKPVKVEFMDGYTLLAPVYTVDPVEKMTDAFLDSYLWYEASKKGLFPTWVKPSDSEPPPLLAYQFAQAINNSPHIWDTAAGESAVLMQASIEDLHERVDWGVMKSLLGLIMDPVLVSYVCARHDVKLEYKDMTYEHHVGLIRGYQFASFLSQFWAFVCDLLLLGSDRAAQIAGPPGRPNPIGAFADPAVATAHPIRAYVRYLDRIYILLRYSRAEANELIDRFFENDRDPANLSVAGYKNKMCWPRDGRMRLFRQDVNLGRAVFWDFRTRLPPAMGAMTWDTAFVSVYSDVNPNLLFDICGFEIRLAPLVRTVGVPPEGENIWPLRDNDTREVTGRAFVQVSADHVQRIQNKIRRCILSIGNAPFHKIAIKWNAVLMEIVPYYREAILGTPGLQEIFVKGETQVQTRIKMSLNSKMPDRFPPVVFYSPPEVGGLGMLSVGASLIPARDLTVGRHVTETSTQYFLKGMTHGTEGDVPVPNVMKSYPAWHREFVDSGRAWAEYRARFQEAKLANRRLSYDEVEDLLDQGIPRIRTLFSKERRILEHDRGWRVRQEFTQFQFGRVMTKWWYNDDHDGRLCAPLDDYKATMIQALGGIDAILEHSLFGATGFASWEGLFWDKKGAFEDRIKNDKLTKAQRQGITQVPNRRFALWWSPTINRSSVYAGFANQIDLTGIVMTGKLEMIKVSYISLFSKHLWEKIHRSVVESLYTLFQTREYVDMLHALDVRLEQTPPKKSFTLNDSCPDIVLEAVARWPLAKPSLLGNDNDAFSQQHTSKFWVDVQLRWGDFDSHDVNQYAREKYVALMKNSAQRYPNPSGAVVVIDLAYNKAGAYGYWIPELKRIVQLAMAKIMKNDPALAAMRSRLHKQLQLYASDPTEAHLNTTNYAELFSGQTTWLVDDSSVFAPSMQASAGGQFSAQSKNGALTILNPKTGQMFLSVIHKSALAGHKKRTMLGREKASEETAAWLRSLPAEERPNKIIVTRRTLFTTMSSTLIDFQTVGLGRSDLSLPLKYLIYHPRLLDIVTTATESKALRFNVFDDWGTTLSPISCFGRLLLILRGFHVNVERTRHILQPDRHVVTEPHHFWPTHTLQEWKDIEMQLSDVILADYARRNSIQVSQLTTKEAQDIILGKEITSVELQNEEAKAIEDKAKKTQLAAQTVKTLNKRGEEITVRTTRTFEIGSFTASTTWRVRAAACSSLAQRVEAIYAADLPAGQAVDRTEIIVLPKRLLQRFIRCADMTTSIVAVCYGFPVPDHPNAREVRAFVFPPQQGRVGSAAMPVKLPTHELLESQGLTPIGIIRTQGGGEPIATTNDLTLLGGLLAENENLDPITFGVINVTIGNADCTVGAAALTDAGITWSMEHRSAPASTSAGPGLPEHTTPAKVLVSDKLEGFSLVPSQGSWNYHLRPVNWGKTYVVKPDVPFEFYHASHRPTHFLQFSRTGTSGGYDDAAAAGGDEESLFD